MDKYLLKPPTSNVDLESRKRPADEQKFSLPKKTATRQYMPATRKVATENRFSALQTDENLDPEAVAYREATSIKKTSRIPPIILAMKQDWTHATIKDLISKYDKSFVLQYRSGSKVAVLCNTSKSHQLIKQGLVSEGALFHTFTRKDEKYYKVVILGLPAYAEEELPKELNAMGFKDITVTKMKVNKNKPSICPPYLVQLPAGSDINKFRQIKYLCNCVVDIRKYRKSSTLGTQCFRCQAFGHASRNCNMPARCVKCTENHSTKDCPRTNPEEKATCCNCGLDHPANYSKCVERQKYLRKLRERNTQQVISHDKLSSHNFPPLRQTDPLPKTNHGLTSEKQPWAQDFKATRNNETSDIRHAGCEPLPTPIIEDKDTLEILQILRAIKAVKAQFSNSSSIIDKVYLVLSHLGRYV